MQRAFKDAAAGEESVLKSTEASDQAGLLQRVEEHFPLPVCLLPMWKVARPKGKEVRKQLFMNDQLLNHERYGLGIGVRQDAVRRRNSTDSGHSFRILRPSHWRSARGNSGAR